MYKNLTSFFIETTHYLNITYIKSIMSNNFGSAKNIGIFPREESEKKKWENYNDMVTVNESQYSFGDEKNTK